MRETRTSGSVRGASGDGRPYRERGAVSGMTGRDGGFSDEVDLGLCIGICDSKGIVTVIGTMLSAKI